MTAGQNYGFFFSRVFTCICLILMLFQVFSDKSRVPVFLPRSGDDLEKLQLYSGNFFVCVKDWVGTSPWVNGLLLLLNGFCDTEFSHFLPVGTSSTQKKEDTSAPKPSLIVREMKLRKQIISRSALEQVKKTVVNRRQTNNVINLSLRAIMIYSLEQTGCELSFEIVEFNTSPRRLPGDGAVVFSHTHTHTRARRDDS